MKPPIAKAQMLIRRPVAEVFEALVDPTITSRFWFSRGSARLEAGKEVRWDWEMYGASAKVFVKELVTDQRILFEWNPENPSTVDFRFEPRGPDATFVTVQNRDFRGDDDQVVAAALDSTSGFAFLLAGMKVYLEHSIPPKLVEDHAPDALVAA